MEKKTLLWCNSCHVYVTEKNKYEHKGLGHDVKPISENGDLARWEGEGGPAK